MVFPSDYMTALDHQYISITFHMEYYKRYTFIGYTLFQKQKVRADINGT